MKRLINIISVLGVSVLLANVCIAGDVEDIKTELDVFWAEMSRSVNEGDFTNLTAAYHPDAVLVSGFKEANKRRQKRIEIQTCGIIRERTTNVMLH